MKTALWVLLGALSLGGARDAQGEQSGNAEQLELWVQALDAAREPEWTQALEALSALGQPAAERVLADFRAVGFAARRARATLLSAIPAPALSALLLPLVDDPDPLVRRQLVLLLGNPALAEEAADERVQALERAALEDPSRSVRNQAREALADCGVAAAVAALDRVLERMPLDEAERAATSLTQIPGGRERLIRRLAGAGADPTSEPRILPDGVRAALLAGYGRALAEVPGGGEERRERLPFLLGRTHPALEVQAAARAALASFVARAAELSEAERAERVLARLGEEGWPAVECLRRRLDLAWLERGDAESGLQLAQALERAAQGLLPEEAEAWELRARIFEGAALTALERRDEAARIFDELIGRLEASRERRDDLFPGPRGRDWTEGGGSAQIDRMHLGALVHLWRALLALEARRDERVQDELRSAHVLFLESRLVAMRTRANDPSTLDSLFERDLSPHTLILFNEKLAPDRRGPALDRAVQLAEAFGQVAPLELMGLEGQPAGRREISDVFFDPVRLALLKELRGAESKDIQRRMRELNVPGSETRDSDQRENLARYLTYRLHELGQTEVQEKAELEQARAAQGSPAAVPSSARLREIHAQLLEYLTPSMHAHALAGELRAEGRTKEARALCERALKTLSTNPLGSSFWSELSSARFELLRGSTLMDESRADDAEQAYRDAERRLAAIQTQMEERQASVADAELARQIEGQTRIIRELRGDALLSLAVNANVRMGKPERALEYFERAYVLNQSPFMRILRACYRARSGKKDEARTVLRSVMPVPSLYYNIACTHALLGEKEEALDYLERDLKENHPSAGSLAQKREWARKDPDLANLRGEPRFERLLEAK